MARRLLQCLLVLTLFPPTSFAHQELSVKPLAEKRVAKLPEGNLFWRIENVDSRSRADSIAGPYSLVVELDGKVWLFTLGSEDEGESAFATKVTRVGPIPRITAIHYLLRINDARGPPGSETSVHSHPGSEAYFVLSGEQSVKAANRTMHIAAGHTEAGQGAERAMQVSSSGATDLHALVMFVVDADKPFSSPATLQERKVRRVPQAP
jgi:mannose-6-phosphate isomerase-like protein (cupin superfamily)